MKTLFNAIIMVAMFVAISPFAVAQWPDYALPNVPKAADGKPNMEGPTPRTPDGKPDLSGIWALRGGGGGNGQRGGQPAGQRGQVAGGGQRPKLLLAFPCQPLRPAAAVNAAREDLRPCLRFLRMGFPSLLLATRGRG